MPILLLVSTTSGTRGRRRALVGLLVKKSVLSEEELQVEKELLRQLHRERPVAVK